MTLPCRKCGRRADYELMTVAEVHALPAYLCEACLESQVRPSPLAPDAADAGMLRAKRMIEHAFAGEGAAGATRRLGTALDLLRRQRRAQQDRLRRERRARRARVARRLLWLLVVTATTGLLAFALWSSDGVARAPHWGSGL